MGVVEVEARFPVAAVDSDKAAACSRRAGTKDAETCMFVHNYTVCYTTLYFCSLFSGDP